MLDRCSCDAELGRGEAHLIATINATFQAKRVEMTKLRSTGKGKILQRKKVSKGNRFGRARGGRTEVFWQERHREPVEDEGDDLGDDHVHMPARKEERTI